jgi:tight adherence protein C
MNVTQLALGVYLVGAAGGYLLIRILLMRRTRPAAPREPAPPDVLARDLAAMLPALPETRRELQQMLWTAGRYRPSALVEYLAVRAVLVVAAVAATGLLVVLAPLERMSVVLVGGGLLAGLGYSLPRLVLGVQSRSRAQRLVRALPLAMDVLALCLTAGQNLLNSLGHASRELARSCPDLALELDIVQRQAHMHSLEQALLQWPERIDIAEVRSLSLLLVQSDRLGTDMVGTLLELADSQRTLQRQKVELQASRSNFWLLFPTVFCLWTASAIVLVGPVYLEFWSYRSDQLRTLIGNARGQVERIKQNETRPAAPPGTERTVPAPRTRPAPR